MKSLFRWLFVSKPAVPPVVRRAPTVSPVRTRATNGAVREKRIQQLLDDPAMSIDESGAGYNPYDTQSIDLADVSLPITASGSPTEADANNPYNNTGGFDPDRRWARVK